MNGDLLSTGHMDHRPSCAGNLRGRCSCWRYPQRSAVLAGPCYHMDMSLRVPVALAVAVTLIILPVIIVRAQAEGEAPTSPVTETVVETGLDAAAAEQASDESDEEIGTEQQGNVLRSRDLRNGIIVGGR
jgi:hypothetical protein